MSVQCVRCEHMKKTRYNTVCESPSFMNDKFVDAKKQRLCSAYSEKSLKKKSILRLFK